MTKSHSSIALSGRVAFLAALLVSIVAGAGWQVPPSAGSAEAQQTASTPAVRG